MSADPGDLTTVANLMAWLGVETLSPGSMTQLQRLVTAVSLWVQNWLSRTITSANYTETRDGLGGDSMLLINWPVSALASVTIDGQSIPASIGPLASGYALVDDAVILRGYRFTPGRGNVVFAYTAGYTSIPPDLEQACLELAAMRWKERDRIGHASKTIGTETVTFITKDMPDSVKTILQQWRKVVPL